MTIQSCIKSHHNVYFTRVLYIYTYKSTHKMSLYLVLCYCSCFLSGLPPSVDRTSTHYTIDSVSKYGTSSQKAQTSN